MFKTGDILLFHEYPRNICFAILDWGIRCVTNSKYSHAGMVIVDPPWTKPGVYVWDSSKHVYPDPQDRKIKFGIAIVPIHSYMEDRTVQIFKRAPVNNETYALFSKEALENIHDNVYGKPYDISATTWMTGFFNYFVPRTTDRFVCSAFVTYALTVVGVLSPNTEWSTVTPAQLSVDGTSLYWDHEYGPDMLVTLS